MKFYITLTLIIITGLTVAGLRDAFKIGYYSATLKMHGIEDKVKDMPWYNIGLFK